MTKPILRRVDRPFRDFVERWKAIRTHASRAVARIVAARDRALHPWRHRRQLERVRQGSRPRSILIICDGNLCRSPYLEAALRRSLPQIEISSAGLIGSGRPAPEYGVRVAESKGLDLRAHRSRLLSPRLLHRADLVIVMDARQARYLTKQLRFPAARVVIAGDLDPVMADSRSIRDPWQQEISVFESSYARLDRCAAILTDLLYSED